MSEEELKKTLGDDIEALIMFTDTRKMDEMRICTGMLAVVLSLWQARPEWRPNVVAAVALPKDSKMTRIAGQRGELLGSYPKG